jgi:uncharacterized protein (DUF1330 family)
MAFYFVAFEKINDPEEYSHYIESFDEVFSRYNGEYLSIDESPVILEGKWDYQKSVILKFETMKDFDDWYYSDDYRRIMKHRISSSGSDIILMEGVD